MDVYENKELPMSFTGENYPEERTIRGKTFVNEPINAPGMRVTDCVFINDSEFPGPLINPKDAPGLIDHCIFVDPKNFPGMTTEEIAAYARVMVGVEIERQKKLQAE